MTAAWNFVLHKAEPAHTFVRKDNIMDYTTMSLVQLRELAKAKNLKKISTLKKAELIERLQQNEKAETDNEKKDTVIETEYDADETVIFNTYEKEIVTKWSSILADDGKAFADEDTFVIFADKDDEVPAYIVVDVEDKLYTSSDAQYAIVKGSAEHEDDK